MAEAEVLLPPTTFQLNITIPTGVTDRPAIPIAHMMREIIPIIEVQVPVVSGTLRDRITNAVRATWTVS